MEWREYFPADQTYTEQLNLCNSLSVIKNRDEQNHCQWLDHKPPYIKREKISELESIIDTVQIDRKNDDENQQHQNQSLFCPFTVLKNKMNDYQREKCIERKSQKVI